MELINFNSFTLFTFWATKGTVADKIPIANTLIITVSGRLLVAAGYI